MRAIPFDTHAYVKKLTAAGVPEVQAEVQAEALADLALTHLPTKQDLADLEARMDVRFKDLEARMDVRFKDLEARMDARFREVDVRFKDLELRLTLRLGAMLVAAVAIVAAIVKML